MRRLDRLPLLTGLGRASILRKRVGFLDWFTPPPPDPFAARPAEFQHRCFLPVIKGLRVAPGKAYVCGDCGCPWVIEGGYSVRAPVTVAVDPNRPWLGTTTVERTNWEEKPCWGFDWAAYRKLAGYRKDEAAVDKLERQVKLHPQVAKCALVHPFDASLSRVRPILFVEPTPRHNASELERFCRDALRREISPPAADYADAVQLWTLPVTTGGEVNTERIERIATSELAERAGS